MYSAERKRGSRSLQTAVRTQQMIKRVHWMQAWLMSAVTRLDDLVSEEWGNITDADEYGQDDGEGGVLPMMTRLELCESIQALSSYVNGY